MSDCLPVSDDIIERILMFMPSFPSLLATILTAKSFYQVFQTHPKSIMRSVAYNITGPALPQALRCIRHPDIARNSSKQTTRWESESGSDSEDMQVDGGRKQSFEEIMDTPITNAETHKIVEQVAVVRRLEELFSFRYLNRSCQTSQLTESESKNFHVAVYNLMLYSSIFHPSTWDSDFHNDDDDAADQRRRREALIKRAKFLSDIPTPELLQIHSVSEFLKEIITWCVRFDGYPDEINNFALAAGPGVIIECFDNPQNGLQPLDDILDFFEEEMEFDPIVSGYLSDPLVKVLEERKTKPPPSDFTHWHSISPRITQENSQCDRCQKSFGLQVYHRSTLGNYSNPNATSGCCNGHSHYEWNSLYQYLKASLRFNSVETDALRDEAKQHGPNLLLKIWDDLWDLNLVKQLPQVSQQSASLPDWTRDNFLCEECFRAFLVENLWVWSRHRRAARGPLLEDCWYGYNCRTQTHRSSHAEKLNHLCEQTRYS
ncbi:hypothetical protein GYMLUDRAFT_34162 [Collybiopsis luxurians FD-317 M1]|nr:hypothetical protein GYMLUDRAFT_34162 [Collybiopsis luxurians FD-317 M1]